MMIVYLASLIVFVIVHMESWSSLCCTWLPWSCWWYFHAPWSSWWCRWREEREQSQEWEERSQGWLADSPTWIHGNNNNSTRKRRYMEISLQLTLPHLEDRPWGWHSLNQDSRPLKVKIQLCQIFEKLPVLRPSNALLTKYWSEQHHLQLSVKI